MLRRCATALALFFAIAASGSAQIIEDFESYVDTPGLQAAWSFGQLDTTTPNPGSGTKSLMRSGEANFQSGYYSVKTPGIALDLSNEDLGVLARRDPASVATTGFRVQIRDGSSISCFGTTLEVSDTVWHLVALDPQDSDCLLTGIDLTDIADVLLWVFNRTPAKGSFLVSANFDDLARFLRRAGFETGDFSEWDSVVPEP